MANRSYTIRPSERLKPSQRRAIAFLECPEDDGINAMLIFEGMDQDTKRMVMSRFDYWIDGGVNDRWFHGWPNNPKHKDCFVFKWNKGRLHHRFYGFLFHPMPKTNARFQVCILCSYATKNSQNTDPSELEGARVLRLEQKVAAAIAFAYSEREEGAKQWPN